MPSGIKTKNRTKKDKTPAQSLLIWKCVPELISFSVLLALTSLASDFPISSISHTLISSFSFPFILQSPYPHSHDYYFLPTVKLHFPQEPVLYVKPFLHPAPETSLLIPY